MTAKIDAMIEATIGKEGRYSNHPSDTGGETMWGITIATARRNGYTGPMRDLPRATAVQIYKSEYLLRPGFGKVADIYPRVAEELFDSGVNLGPYWPSLWLQICLNAFNAQGRHYGDIAEDAAVGPGTIRALTAYKAKRGAEGETVMLKALNALQGARYIDLARGRPANEDFVYGWIANRVEI